MMSFVCPRCGSTAYHYNSARRRMECDGCGTPLVSSQEAQMKFDLELQKARDFLATGHWSQAAQAAQILSRNYPGKLELYQIMIRAVTQDYRDLDIREPSLRTIAEEAWNVLDRMNALDANMLTYARKRHKKQMDTLSELQGPSSVYALLTLVSVGLFLYGVFSEYTNVGVLALFGIFIFYHFYKTHLVDAPKVDRVTNSGQPANPFVSFYIRYRHH